MKKLSTSTLVMLIIALFVLSACKKSGNNSNLALLALAGGGDHPWVQDAYLKASNAEANDSFGYSIAASGDTIVVGATQEDSNQTTITNTDGSASTNNGAINPGAAYVFKKDGSGNWIQDAYLKASNTATLNDYFGCSVAASGNTIVVGAMLEDSNQTTVTNTDGLASTTFLAADSGAAYVFKKDGSGNWIQDAYLKASNAEASDNFGNSVSVSGDTIVVGAYNEDSNQTSITNADGSASADNSASASGAAYVFLKNGSGNWVQDAYLKASNAESNDNFGYSVSVSGDTIVVGAYLEDSNQTTITNTDGSASTNNGAINPGAAYVFKKDGSGNWIQDAYLKASNVGGSDYFGCSVAVSGDTIVVGALQESSSQTNITNTDGSAATDNTAGGSGAAYVFKKDGSGNWIQDAYLKASNAETINNFGISVAVSGNTIVVGAFHENSNQTSIDNTDGSASTDNTATQSGAAYVFKKDGSGNWIQDAYLKASNAEAGDFFGYSVAVSGDTIAIGTTAEASNQNSITNTDGSASANNDASNSGAVYVFKR